MRVKTVLARKPRVRQAQDSDLAYMWAAYRQGFWSELLPPGLSQQVFEHRAIEIISRGHYDWIIEAPVEGTIQPVGIILAQAMLDGRRIEPHVDWFPWATTRNRLEGIAAFLRDVSKRFKILVYSKENSRVFFEKMKRYGLIRHGCKVVDFFGRGEHAFLFYTVGI